MTTAQPTLYDRVLLVVNWWERESQRCRQRNDYLGYADAREHFITGLKELLEPEVTK